MEKVYAFDAFNIFRIEFKLDNYFNYEVEMFHLQSDELIWSGGLMPLWEISNYENDRTVDFSAIHDISLKGDYFQHTIHRKNNLNYQPNLSLTSVFHEVIKQNKNELDIESLYSTSEKEELSLGLQITDAAKMFWIKQVLAGKAIYIENQMRFKAIL